MPNLFVDFANNSCGILFRRAPFHIIDLSMLRQRVRQRQMHMPLQQMWLLLDENSVTTLNTYLNY